MAYYIAYLLSITLSFFSYNKRIKLFIVMVIVLFLSFFASLRGAHVDRDYLNYYYLFFIQPQDTTYYLFEPISRVIFTFCKFLDLKFYYVLFIFSFFSIALKLITIMRLDYSIPLFLSVYIGYFYFQHDMTQIRLALALGFYYISFFYCYSNKNLSRLFFIFAILTHFSTCFFLLTRFDFICKRLPLLVIITICFFILNIFGFNITFFIKFLIQEIPYLNKYVIYLSSEWQNQEINVLSFTNLSFLFITILCVFIFYYCDKDNLLIRKALTNVVLGLCVIPLFSSIPVLSFRASQVYLIFFPLIISHCFCKYIYCLNWRQYFIANIFLHLICIAFGLILLYVVIFHAGILNDYETVFSDNIE